MPRLMAAVYLSISADDVGTYIRPVLEVYDPLFVESCTILQLDMNPARIKLRLETCEVDGSERSEPGWV